MIWAGAHVIMEIKCAINVRRLNHSQTTPCHLWKNCLPRNWSLVPKRLGTTALVIGQIICPPRTDLLVGWTMSGKRCLEGKIRIRELRMTELTESDRWSGKAPLRRWYLSRGLKDGKGMNHRQMLKNRLKIPKWERTWVFKDYQVEELSARVAEA